jgi:hypothetical protein
MSRQKFLALASKAALRLSPKSLLQGGRETLRIEPIFRLLRLREALGTMPLMGVSRCLLSKEHSVGRKRCIATEVGGRRLLSIG